MGPRGLTIPRCFPTSDAPLPGWSPAQLRSSPLRPLLSQARPGQTLDFQAPRLGGGLRSGGNRGGARRLGARTGRGRPSGVAHIRQIGHFTGHGKHVNWPDGCPPVPPENRRSCPNQATAGRRLLARGSRTPFKPRGTTASAGRLHAWGTQTRVGSGPPSQRPRLLRQRRPALWAVATEDTRSPPFGLQPRARSRLRQTQNQQVRSPSHSPHCRRRGRRAARNGVLGTTRINGNRNIGDSLARCAIGTTEGAVTGRQVAACSRRPQ